MSRSVLLNVKVISRSNLSNVSMIYVLCCWYTFDGRFFLEYLRISSTTVTCGDLKVTGKSNSADSVNKKYVDKLSADYVAELKS